MAMDFVAARKRIEEFAAQHIEFEPMAMEASMIERIQLSLTESEINELLYVTLEESK
jgi:hypothetical protein